MSTTSTTAALPLRHTAEYERPAPDEPETFAAIVATMRKIADITHTGGRRAVRSVHAKGNALLRGELRVLDGLPPELAQGLYATPGATHPVALRLSTIPGDILDDSINIGLPRGLAIKIMDVAGERLPGSEDATTQDYVLVNGPAFAAPDAKSFLGTLKLLAATTDIPQGFKKVAATLTQGAARVIGAFGGDSALLNGMGGHPHTHPLGETYYSQVPMLHGPYMAKLAVAPVSASLTALTGAAFDVDDAPDAIRDAMVGFFQTHAAEWEIRVQLCTDLATMPIEDASVVWPEAQSPYRAVARITVAQQPAWNAARFAAMDEGLAFSPWHGLAAHRPLGGIMRARRAAYGPGAELRGQRNGCPMTQPRGGIDLAE